MQLDTSLQRRKAFTLIELLVSISILALLSAMALPAMQSAFDRADQSLCMANLRQLGQAMMEFESDHGHFPAAELPVMNDSGAVLERKRWYHQIAPYLSAPTPTWSSGGGRADRGEVTLPSEDDSRPELFPDVYRCPCVKHWDVGRNMSYGYNHQYLGDARYSGLDSTGEPLYRKYPVRRTSLANMANTILLLDSDGTGSDDYKRVSAASSRARGNCAFLCDPPVLPAWQGSKLASDGEIPMLSEATLLSKASDRHHGGSCVLYVDGHVKWQPLADLMKSNQAWSGEN